MFLRFPHRFPYIHYRPFLYSCPVDKVPEYTLLLEKSGDSLEPIYHDKELIWIEQIEQLEDGETGIFYLEGNAYVKKFQNNRKGTYLISLNKAHDPVPITEKKILAKGNCYYEYRYNHRLIKKRRTSLGLTQRQVADRTEMNVHTVINIEKGKAIPNLLYTMKLAKFMGMRVEDVFEYRRC